jgi:hypothetical protein
MKSCYASERMVEAASELYVLERGSYPKGIADLVPAYAPKTPACPSGGVYSLAQQDSKAVCTCSKHGHHPADPSAQ